MICDIYLIALESFWKVHPQMNGREEGFSFDTIYCPPLMAPTPYHQHLHTCNEEDWGGNGHYQFERGREEPNPCKKKNMSHLTPTLWRLSLTAISTNTIEEKSANEFQDVCHQHRCSKAQKCGLLLNKLANNRSDRLLCHCVILMLADKNASSFKFFLERAFRPAGGHALCLWVVLFVFVIFHTLYILRETELP